MELIDNSHLNDPHRLEFEEYVYDSHRTAEELRHLLLKQYDEIQELKRKTQGAVSQAPISQN